MTELIPVHLIDDIKPMKMSKRARKAYRILFALNRLPPIIVRRRGERFVLLDGNRRVTAARKLGLDDIHAIVEE